MKILDLYIARAILSGTLMAFLVLVSLEVFYVLIDEFGDVGRGSYGFADAIYYILLTMPSRFYNLSPVAVLVGSLLSLGALASKNELTAIRAAGVSILRIARSAVQAGLVLLIAVALTGEFLVPSLDRLAQSVQSRKEGIQVSHEMGSGLWVRDGNYYIHIGHIYPDLQLQDIDILHMNADSKLLSSTYAESAIYNNGKWELRDVHRSYFADNKVVSETKKSELRSRLIDPEMFGVLTVKPEMMSARDLYHYTHYLERNRLDASGYRLAFWLKMTTPLSCIVMLLLVLPFVFSSLRSVGSGQLLVIGILMGLGFYILIQIASRTGQIYGISPFISATFPVMIFAVIGLIGLTKIR